MHMQLKDILQKTTLFFKDKGIASARLDTELLLARALKWDRVRLYMNYEYPLSESEIEACRALVRRRAQGEPVAYILGERDFYKSSFEVEPGVLIPRPETEGVVEDSVAWLKTQPPSDGYRLIDMGCGSGCIGLSILKEVPEARLLAVDISSVAIRVTTKNAERLGVAERLAVLNLKVEELTQQFYYIYKLLLLINKDRIKVKNKCSKKK
jgi:release factor glutamine methyltransferase